MTGTPSTATATATTTTLEIAAGALKELAFTDAEATIISGFFGALPTLLIAGGELIETVASGIVSMVNTLITDAQNNTRTVGVLIDNKSDTKWNVNYFLTHGDNVSLGNDTLGSRGTGYDGFVGAGAGVEGIITLKSPEENDINRTTIVIYFKNRPAYDCKILTSIEHSPNETIYETGFATSDEVWKMWEQEARYATEGAQTIQFDLNNGTSNRVIHVRMTNKNSSGILIQLT